MKSTLICTRCNKTQRTEQIIWRCECGGLLDIDMDATFPIELIEKREPTMWRYREALPINSDNNIISFNEGFTPLLELKIDKHLIHVKQDYLFPTGSYKDRGASVMISKAKELGVERVIEDSSGNAGAAVAAYCARAGITCDIFVPDDTTRAKITQILCYGAHLHRVKGTREDTAKAAQEAAEHTYYASHYYNPFFFQGTKTFAFEVCEQLYWRAPNALVLPVGNGTLVIGAYLGFAELLSAGVIDRMPRIIGVQAACCAPLANAYEKESDEILPVKTRKTIAEGIAIAVPLRGSQILTAVRMSNGYFITVSEDEIKDAFSDLCACGLFVEPTAAATIAGVKKYLHDHSRKEEIVSTLTGHGLKNTRKVRGIVLKK